jgi:hypothetical protein
MASGISLSSVARDLVRSTLFGKDFDSNVTEIENFIQLRFGPEVANNIVASEQGKMLIEMFAFGLSTMNWYGDRQADDTNLRDVRLRTAAVSIARQLGYKPRAAVAPAIQLTMTISPVPTARLIVEKGRKLNGPDGLTFETTAETIFDVGEVGPKLIDARQGESKESLFVSDGTAGQTFFITDVPTDSSIAQDSPQAFVDGNEWPELVFLSFEQTNQFEFQYGFNPPRALFGDGIAGNIPPRDAEIRVRFFVTDGTGGSVPANSVTTFIEPLTAGGVVITPTLTHDDPSTPGSDRELISSIKTNAPQVFQAADRAVTQADIDALINAFIDPTWGAVAIGRATVPRSVDQDAQAVTIIESIESSCATVLNIVLLGGTFELTEVVTGGTSGATATIVGIDPGLTFLTVFPVSGVFIPGEVLTVLPSGGSSAATATLSSVAPNDIVVELRAYWDKVLSSNCQANVVVAQILGQDSVGRYVSAPSALAAALEVYLDARLESTVKATVVDGSVNLLPVDLSVDLRTDATITSAEQQEVVKANVRSALETELLGRSYGASVWISDLYRLSDEIAGVDNVNIAITNQPTRIDSFGNLAIEDFEVITLGVSPVIIFIV